MVRVLGLDVATNTGYAILDTESDKLIAYGMIKLKPKHTYRDRFKNFRAEVLDLIDAHKVEAVSLEGVYQGRNAKSTAYLNNLRGIVIELVPPTVDLLSAQVKKARKEALGYGGISKGEVYSWAISKYKIKDKVSDDVTDAILLAKWAGLKLTNA